MQNNQDSTGKVRSRDEDSPQDVRENSLGDEMTYADLGPVGPDSLGGEITMAGIDGGANDIQIDYDMDVIDLNIRYEFEGILGKGGMGEVKLATDTRLGRKVAIKQVLGSAVRSAKAWQRFETGAKTIAKLSHPNIVQVYEYGLAKDGPFMVLEYVSGGSLLDKCQFGPLPIEEAIEITCQLCEGLNNLHSAGIIHRDIKPANVLMTEDSIPKLSDFDLAKEQVGDTGMTMAGAVLGTVDFMPPEQRIDATMVDSRSDLWALAATLYQMVTGRSPKIIKFNDLPSELHEVLGKALEDGMADRYQTAVEFRDALRLCLVDTPESVEDLGEGECPHCGTRNEPSRRFCRSCAKSLEVECLSCSSGMPAWESVCGRCGERQEDLADDYREKMADQKTQAERALDEYQYDRAVLLAQALGNEDDLRFRHLSDWSVAFLEEIESHRNEQLEKIDQQIDEALKHEEESDFSSALRALEKIPVSLRHLSTPKHSLTAMELIANYEAIASDIKSRDQEIRKLVKSKELDGLIEKVEQLKELQPKRLDLNKLHEQLMAREEKLNSTRDEAYQQAAVFYADYKYRDCLRQLHRIHPVKMDGEVDSLQQQAKQDLARLKELRQQIKESVAVTNYDGLLYLIDEFLVLEPKNNEMLKLRKQLVLKEQEYATLNAEAVRKASGYYEKCKFSKAVETLEAVPGNTRNHETLELLSDYQFLWDQQRVALKALSDQRIEELRCFNGQLDDKNCERTGFASAELYRECLNSNGLSDPKFEEVFLKFQNAIEDYRRQLAAHKFKTKIKFIACAITLTVIIFFIGVGCWLNQVLRSEAEAMALASGDWEAVLKINPNNFKAIELKAEATVKVLQNPFAVQKIDLSPDGKTVVSCGESRIAKIWDIKSGQEILSLNGHSKNITSVSFSGDGKEIVTGGFGDTCRIWDASSGKEIKSSSTVFMKKGVSGVCFVEYFYVMESSEGTAFSPNIELVYSSGSYIGKWRRADGIELMSSRVKTDKINSISVSSARRFDDCKIATACRDCKVYIYDLRANEKVIFEGHTDEVNSVAFSPNSKILVSGSSDKTVRIWNSVTKPIGQMSKQERKDRVRKGLLTLVGHTADVTCVAFSPDGKQIVSGSYDKTIRVWDSTSGSELMVLNGHKDRVNSVAFSSDGLKIVSGSSDKSIRIWDLGTGSDSETSFVERKLADKNTANLPSEVNPRPSPSVGGETKLDAGDDSADLTSSTAFKLRNAQTLKGHTSEVYRVAFSPDGNSIVSGGNDNKVRTWDAKTGKGKLTLTGHSKLVNSVGYSPNGRNIVSGSWDKTIKVWDANTGKEKLTLRGHTGSVTSVAYSPNGNRIASGSYDKTVKIWDAQTGKFKITISAHKGLVYSIAFSPDGNSIVSGSSDGTLKIWNALTGREKLTLKGHSGSVRSVAFSSDGNRIVSGGIDGTVKLWDAGTGKEKTTFKGHSGGVFSVAFCNDGNSIVSGGDDKYLRIWDVRTGKLEITETAHYKRVYSASFSPDGNRIVSGSGDATIKLWDFGTEVKLETPMTNGVASRATPKQVTKRGEFPLVLKGHASTVRAVGFSPTGKTVVSGSDDKSVKLWDAQTGRLIRTLRGHTALIDSVVFNSSGTLVASAGRDKTIKIWDSETGVIKKTLSGHRSGVKCLAFSADGNSIASGSFDRTVKVWDVSRGKLKFTFNGKNGAFLAVAFSADGKSVLSGSADGILAVWDAESGKLKTQWPVKSGCYSMNICCNGTKVLCGGGNGVIQMWDIVNKREEFTFRANNVGTIFGVVANPRGTRLGIASGEIRVWDLKKDKSNYEVFKQSGGFLSLAFGPDGKRIVASNSKNVCIF